jgi:cytochrome c2
MIAIMGQDKGVVHFIICFMMLLLSNDIVTVQAQNGLSLEYAWKGKEVFHNKGCIQCHSVYSIGGSGGPDLGEEKFYGTYLELAAIMWNHFPKMSEKMEQIGYSFPKLNTKETEQLISYLAFIRYKGEAGRESTGRKLLKSKRCLDCHKFGGEGGNIGPNITTEMEYLSPLILMESMWNHGPHMIEIFKENNIERPMFKNNEIVDIAAAIQGYMPPTNRIPPGSYDLGDTQKGKNLIEKKGCIQCHTLDGKGGKLATDFSKININYSVTELAGKMWNHAPKMWALMKSEKISIPVFEKGEMVHIVGYLYQVKLSDTPGDPDRGKNLIMNRGCSNCHSNKEGTKNIEPDFTSHGEIKTPLSMINAMFNHAPVMQKKHMEEKLDWPNLTGKDMADFYAYLLKLSSKKVK